MTFSPEEQRLKAHLKTLSQETGVAFNRLFKETFLQHFIVRVAGSPYRENLIFKGGLCLKQYLDLGRGTKDLDFLLKQVQAEEATLTRVFEDIASIDSQDGFEFRLIRIQLLEDNNKPYPGYRILFAATCGNIKDTVQLDLGVDDVVDTQLARVLLLTVNNKPLFDENSVELQVYPLEYIFSEKLQTIIFRAEFNSRMKDFYDVYQIINSGHLNIEKTVIAIQDTFNHRKTSISQIKLDSQGLQRNWERFLAKEKLQAPTLSELVDEINHFLLAKKLY